MENINLNTTFNLSFFASTTEALGSIVLSQNLNNNRTKRIDVEDMLVTVKELSRESDESLNDRSRQIIHDDPTLFQSKNCK